MPPHPTAVLLAVALTDALIGSHTPRLKAFRDAGRVRTLRPVLPAVTCSVQASMLTGLPPSHHGIVGNGWFDRALAEVHFWKQSNRLVRAEKVWETARRLDPSVTTANLFWWFNMYSTAEYSVTPRPIYKADGRKIPDCYAEPPDLRRWLQSELGTFPLFRFWGPGAGIASTRWIADAAMLVHARHTPTLTLVYLPHLDYALQKFGPDSPEARAAAAELDAEIGRLLDHLLARGVRVLILSEYGIEPVDTPVHINRTLREAGFLRVREEDGGELLDAGASDAFAVADHQAAHVYVRDSGHLPAVASLLRADPDIEYVLDGPARAELGIAHERAGDLVAVAREGAWFTYYHWLTDARAPDFARTVDIHRKPGYDPAELFIDPHLAAPKLRLAAKLARKRLGFRTLMDVTPLDATLVRGSHGRTRTAPAARPVLITPDPDPVPALPDELPCTAVRDVILRCLGFTADR